jgi:hypothetical protein
MAAHEQGKMMLLQSRDGGHNRETIKMEKKIQHLFDDCRNNGLQAILLSADCNWEVL